jgi:hypothetical protein
MLFDWLIYGLLIWGSAALLNRTIFREAPASRTLTWTLTVLVFFINLVALSAIQYIRYQFISDELGFRMRPRGPIDGIGALTFSWLFYYLLRKTSKIKESPVSQSSVKVANPQAAVPVSAAPQRSIPAPQREQIKPSTESEELMWALALAEFEGPDRRSGLWAKAFAESKGNAAAAQASYLVMRFAELTAERQARDAKQLAHMHELQEATALEYVATDEPALPSEPNNIPMPIEESPAHPDAEVMLSHGIKFENDRYHFMGYKYDNLQDAINYSNIQAQRKDASQVNRA